MAFSTLSVPFLSALTTSRNTSLTFPAITVHCSQKKEHRQSHNHQQWMAIPKMLIHLVMASQGGKSLHLEMEDLIPATLRVGYGTRLVAVSKQTKKRQGKYEPNTAKASKDVIEIEEMEDVRNSAWRYFLKLVHKREIFPFQLNRILFITTRLGIRFAWC